MYHKVNETGANHNVLNISLDKKCQYFILMRLCNRCYRSTL